MKKIFLLIGVLFLTSCGIDDFRDDETLIRNAATNYMEHYTELEGDAILPLYFDISDMEFYSEMTEQYYLLALERQYQNLTYKITNVSIYSNTASAKVEIYTYDFIQTREEAENYTSNVGNYLISNEDKNIEKLLFEDYLYKQMYKEEDRIKQEIVLTLALDENNTWQVNKVDNDTLLKIRGLFEATN